ncbi:ABC transporter permease subunit [Glycomyces halotolerans]
MKAAKRLTAAALYAPVLAVLAFALAGPSTVSRPTDIVAAPLSPPSGALPLGADHMGRDVWAMLLAGGRELVLIPVFAVALTVLIGTATGMAAGYFGGVVDSVISRVDTVALSIPVVLFMLLLLHNRGYSAVTMTLIVLFASVPFVSRLARAATVHVARSDYVEQATATGSGPMRTMTVEIAPAVLAPVLADAGTRLSVAVGLTATAGFLGFTDSDPNWGRMINDNIAGISLNMWASLAPSILLVILAIGANYLLDDITRRFVN